MDAYHIADFICDLAMTAGFDATLLASGSSADVWKARICLSNRAVTLNEVLLFLDCDELRHVDKVQLQRNGDSVEIIIACC